MTPRMRKAMAKTMMTMMLMKREMTSSMRKRMTLSATSGMSTSTTRD